MTEIEMGHATPELVATGIKRIKTGPRMSQAVVHGSTAYLAGQVGQGETVGQQTADILKNIDVLLEAAGSSKMNLLSATIWLTDMANFAEMNAVWDGWVAPGHTPGRVCVEAKLAAPQYWVEIAVIAAI